MKITSLSFISLTICLSLLHQALATPVFIWSNKARELSRGQSHFLGNDLSFYSFDYQVLANIKKESPDVIFMFVTSSLTLDDLTEYGNVYTSDNEDACIHNTKTAIQDSASNLFIDEVLPASSSILTDLKSSFYHFYDYKVVQISSADELTEELQQHDKLIVMVTSARLSLPDSLQFIDERVLSLLQIAEEKNLDYISILLGNNQQAKAHSRYVREAAPLTKGASSSNKTLEFVVHLSDSSVVLFRTQNISIFPNTTSNKTHSVILTPNNTIVSGSKSSSNNSERYFEIKSTDLKDEIMYLRFIFPNGTSKTNLTSKMTLLTGYWSMMIELTFDSNKSESIPFFPPKNALLVPLGFSYHCSPSLKFTIPNNTITNVTGMMVMISELQVQPFLVSNSSNGKYAFNTADDCVGFYTLDIWMGIFACFLVFSMLYCAIMATMAISTSDRQDNPQGKPLIIENASQ